MNFYSTVVKTPFALLQIQPQMLFGNAVDVVLPVGKMCTMVDAQMAKVTDIWHIISFITIRIDDTVRLDLLTDNRQ